MKNLLRNSGLRTAALIAGAFAIVIAILLLLASLGGVWSFLEGPQGAIDDMPAGTSATGNDVSIRRGAGIDEPPVQIRIRSPEAAPGIANDSAGPLFVEANMAPGATSTRCVSVTNVGVQLGDVRLYGSVEDEGLARHIAFSVEAAYGAVGRNCLGFKGKKIFTGTLADLANNHRDFASGIKTSELLYPKEALAFRLTQRLDLSSPQGVRARVRFEWEARGAGAPSPLREGRDPLSYQARSPEANADDASIQRSIPEIVLDVAVGVAKRGWTWVILLLLVIAFLIVQDRIDRRDPRLARARVHPEPDLTFDDEELAYRGTEANNR